MRQVTSTEVTNYLQRLGITDPGSPSVPALFALHRAHVQQVPYEVLDIQLGRPTTVDPHDCFDRVLRGRGGYCVQLNSAFSVLLAALGYDVALHAAGVQASRTAPMVDASFAPHLALSVTLDGDRWLVDVGLGDGLYEPLPALAGVYRQGPFGYRLSPSHSEPGGLRFDHDPRGSVAGLDIRLTPAGPDEFARWHPYLVSSPQSRLVRTLTVMRRDANSSYALIGCLLRHAYGSGRTVREIQDQDEWFGVLADTFRLRPADLVPAEQDALWSKVRQAHEAWLGSRAASGAS